MELDVRFRKKIGEFRLDVAFNLSELRTGVFGPSGSGKSTLVNILAGLETADSGYISIGKDVLFDSGKGINLSPNKRRVGVVFQHGHLFPHMSVLQNVLYGYKRIDVEERLIDPDELFRVLGINSLLERNVTTLSGGEQQRVALARTVLACPRLILLDEPLTGLGEDLKYQIIPYLNRVFSEYEIPMLFISHSHLEMKAMTDTVLVIEGGKIRGQIGTESLESYRSKISSVSLSGKKPLPHSFCNPYGIVCG